MQRMSFGAKPCPPSAYTLAFSNSLKWHFTTWLARLPLSSWLWLLKHLSSMCKRSQTHSQFASCGFPFGGFHLSSSACSRIPCLGHTSWPLASPCLSWWWGPFFPVHSCCWDLRLAFATLWTPSPIALHVLFKGGGGTHSNLIYI